MRPLLFTLALYLFFPSGLQAEGNSEYSILSESGAKKIAEFYRRPPTDITGYWMPTDREVGVAEARLAEYFAGKRRLSGRAPKDYFRQYGGIIVGGERRLYISFLERTILRDHPPGIRREPIIVHDGGDGFWRVDFDPRTRTFSHRQSNGSAEENAPHVP